MDALKLKLMDAPLPLLVFLRLPNIGIMALTATRPLLMVARPLLLVYLIPASTGTISPIVTKLPLTVAQVLPFLPLP